jgi:hypothetical protein
MTTKAGDMINREFYLERENSELYFVYSSNDLIIGSVLFAEGSWHYFPIGAWHPVFDAADFEAILLKLASEELS